MPQTLQNNGRTTTPVVFALALLFVAAPELRAADVDYERDVKPLFAEKCSACHGALKQEGGLRLDAATLIRKGGDSGAVISVGSAKNSPLIARITSEDESERMPPEGEGERLDQEQVAKLSVWINRGAPAPADETIPIDPKDHWAYQLPVRPDVQDDVDPDWSANPIDAFIAAEHQRSRVRPTYPAAKRVLIRRLSLDLVGLPPTRQEVDEFLRDESASATEHLVDRLLASPHYGERWGRHWMDVWRYSDWNGYKDQLRGSQRHIWRWRDWIIQSLNEDKGYDRMILEMLAGDELAPEDLDTVRATGFLARNYHNKNRNIWLDATVEHTAKAFLGMTLNCARCHDHKYDPIAQPDYYAFRAVFEPHQVRTERLSGQPDIKKDGVPRVFDADPAALTYLYRRGNEKHPDKEHPISPAVPMFLNRPLHIEPVQLPAIAVLPNLRPDIERESIVAAQRQLTDARRALEKLGTHSNDDHDAGDSKGVKLAKQRVATAEAKLNSMRARWNADRSKHLGADGNEASQLATMAAAAERAFNLQKARLDLMEKEAALATANSIDKQDGKKRKAAITKARQALDVAKKNHTKAAADLKLTDSRYTPVGDSYPRESTGRRAALARWIASPQNPLTARVAVNHIWLRHFGEPLVPNVFDFGLRSPEPKHAELLDWLAVELMENGWSMKHLHRLIATSRCYQLASSATIELSSANRKIDPNNRLFWRANPQRLDAEVVRDNILFVAGSLNTTRGGPDIDYAKGESVPRRSVYFRHAYEKQMEMLVVFDAAGPNECYRRSESVIPQQALALANSTLALSQSRKLAGALWRETANQTEPQTAFIRSAFEIMLTRQPTNEETAACRKFLKQQSVRLSQQEKLTEFGGIEKPAIAASTDPAMRSRESLIHVLMNHNDFITAR